MPESVPTTRQNLIQYCLRALGAPVIEINVDDTQLEDRLTEALEFFNEFHFDGVEKVFLKYQVTADDIANGWIPMVSTNTGASSGFKTGDATQAVTESGLTGSVPIDSLITSVTKVWHLNTPRVGMFDLRYQYALNDLYTFGSMDMINYDLTKQYLALLEQYLSPEKSVRFSKVTNKLYIDMDWARAVTPGDYLIIECYRILDPKIYPEIYNDRLLKKYLTALIKRQWGQNLIKYGEMRLPGGSVLNGRQLYDDAMVDIKEIEQKLMDEGQEPASFFVG